MSKTLMLLQFVLAVLPLLSTSFGNLFFVFCLSRFFFLLEVLGLSCSWLLKNTAKSGIIMVLPQC